MAIIQPTQGRLVARTCPECGSQLRICYNKMSDSYFLGCGDWPQCEYACAYPMDQRARAMNAPMLPGME